MRRHEALIPLSRFHRSCLFLALMAKKNAPAIKGYPTELYEKIEFAIAFYNSQLVPHFEKEQKLWDQVEGKSEKLRAIITDLKIERNDLKGLFEKLSSTANETTLHKMGAMLEKHVRKEERALFQQIQADLTEKELAKLDY